MERLKEEVEKIVNVTGAVAKVKRIRQIKRKQDQKGRDMVCVRFASVKEKLEVIKEEAKLRDKKRKITDDLTERESRIDC